MACSIATNTAEAGYKPKRYARETGPETSGEAAFFGAGTAATPLPLDHLLV